ncbi:hypothetical protein [Rufibacter roseus]|uniref:Phage tail tape measure protein n=1 Tax=Rufibacter roseus TaxID=1567108 RepID=A0ABW2DKA2_9BACT|nr:hypothetical protein [Rufibacter roseus]
MNVAELNVKISAELSELDKGLKRAASGVDDLGDNVDRASNRMQKGTADSSKGFTSMGNVAKGVGGVIAAAFTIDAVLSLGKNILDTTAKFQKMEAVLTNTLGSQSAAQNAMLMIQDIAAKTPFAVDQLTESYVKLANRGIQPTSQEIIKLGDLAASTGKDFDQLTEGLLDAMTGEFERLKEFGITASSQGDKVAFTFKGVTTEVAKTDAAIKEYVMGLGDVEGVSGSMAAISETLTGKISNLGDSFDQMFLTIGSQQSGVFSSTISFLDEMVKGVTALIATTDQLGQKMSARGVSEYSSKVAADFKALAEQTKASGGDVETALKSQADALIKDLETKQRIALSNLEKFREESGGILNKIGELADQSGVKYSSRKGAESTLASEVSLIQGQIAAIEAAYASVGKAAAGSVDKQIGTLARLKKELADLQDIQLNALGSGRIEAINEQIYAKEQEIKKYLELGDAQRKQQQALQDLHKQLALNEQYYKAFGDSHDYVEGKRSVLESGIKSLINAGFKPGSAAVQEFKAYLDSLALSTEALASTDLFQNVMPTTEGFKKNQEEFKPQTADIIPAPQVDWEGWDKFKVDLREQYEDVNLMQDALMMGTTMLTDTLGGALAAGLSGGMSAGINALEQGLKQMAKVFGEYMLKWGVAQTILANPMGPAAIVAGVALMAFAGAGGSKPATGGSPRSSYSTPTSRSGSYSSAGAALNIQGETRLSGNDIVISYQRSQEQGRRTG